MTDDWLEGGDATENEEPLSARGENVPKLRMVEILGCARATFDAMIKDGCPFVAKGGRAGQRWIVNTAEVIEWLRRRDVALATGNPSAANLDQAKHRDKEAQARLREIQIAQKEGELLPVATFISWAKKKFADIRARIQSFESQLTGITNEQSEQIQQAVQDLLKDLSERSAEGWNEDGDGSDSMAGDGDERGDSEA